MYYKALIIIIAASVSLSANAETMRPEQAAATTEQSQNTAVGRQEVYPFPYQLYKVDFSGLFLRLNTRNGTIDRIRLTQAETEPYITEPLIAQEAEKDGRFELHYTETNSTLILIDRIDGRMWRVQITANKPQNRLVPYNY